jgi:uncharacterized repeat protein (TIGR01451 family)
MDCPVARFPRLFALLSGVLLALHAPSARAQSAADTALYVVNNTTTLSVMTSRTTGTLATVGTLAFATSALARDPVTKRIYYIATNAATPVGRVAYYDPATGTNTIINNVGTAGDNPVRMTFGGGLIYAIGDVAHGSLLYTIDPNTGVYTTLGAVRVGSAAGELFPDNGDLAFDPISGVLYANGNRPAGASGTSLYTINLATRIATHIGVLATGVTQASLTFAAGILYSGGGGGELYTVNTATGAGTLVVNTALSYYDFATGPPVADLAITALTASATWAVGTAETYTITVRNNGPYPATGITLVDTLPTGLQYTGFSGAGWACSNALQIVTCTRAAALASATNATNLVLNVTVLGTVAPSVTNAATVSGALADQNLANNRATATTPVTVRSVAVTPDAGTATRLPNNVTNPTYTQVFVVTNTGSLTGTYNVVATVAPAGVATIVSVNGVAGSTGTTGATALAANGGTSNVTVVYSVAAAAATGATATITLTATSTGAAPVATDAGNLTVTVARAGLSMAKALYRDDRTTLVSGGVAAGEYVQYRVTVTSTGSADATGVSVADNIPAQVTYVTAAGDLAGWTFAPAAPSPTLTATLAGVLTSGSSRYFWIRVRVK